MSVQVDIINEQISVEIVSDEVVSVAVVDGISILKSGVFVAKTRAIDFTTGGSFDVAEQGNKVLVTLPSDGGSGSVTSVGDLSPLFTTANPTTTPTFTAINQNANLVYAGPATGAAAAPTFRSLVRADLPFTGTPDGSKFLRDDLVWSVLPSSGHVIENSGTPLTARANLNFTNGLTASDNSPDTDVKLGGQITDNITLYGLGFGGNFTKLIIDATEVDGVPDSPIEIGSNNGSTSFTGFRLSDTLEPKYVAEIVGATSSIVVGNATTINSLSNIVTVESSGIIITLDGSNTFREASDFSSNYTDLSYINRGYANSTYAPISVFSGHVIENNGTPLIQRSNLNFSGGLIASDNTPDTDVKFGSSSATGNHGVLDSRYINIGTDVTSGFLMFRANYLDLVSRGSKLTFNSVAGSSSSMSLTSQSNFGDASLNFTSSGAAGDTATVQFNDTRTVKLGIQYALSSYGSDFTDDTLIHRLYADSRYVLSTAIIGPTNGGTGVANNADSTLTISGNFATTLTVTNTTTLTLPTTGTLATLAGVEELTNKTLGTGTVFSVIPTINDGITFTFNPNATVSGINVGGQGGNVSTIVNGNLWYNSSTGSLNTNKLNTTHSVITSPDLTSSTNRIPIITGSSNSITSSPNLTFITNRILGTTLYLTLSAGTATAGTAPLKMTSGTNLTTAEAGAFEYNGADLFFTKSGTTRGTVLVSTAVTTEVVVSDTTLTISHAGTTYKILARA